MWLRKWLSISFVIAWGAMPTLGWPDEPTTAASPSLDATIVLEPSEDPTPVVIGQPRLDGTGRLPGKMVDFKLQDQLGREVTRESLLGQPWVANFIFAECPTHCPATLSQIYELQRRLKDTDVKFVTVTVNPAQDTVAKMAELSKAFGADPERWLFLTGEPVEISKLIVDGFQQVMVSNPMRLAHSLNLMHVDAQGNIVGQYRYHFQEPEGPDQINLLRQVLLGQIETPDDNKFVPDAAAKIVSQALTNGDVVAGDAALPAADSASDSPVVPAWVDRLRTTNAMLNSLATLLLLAGFWAIKSGQPQLHKRLMLFAFAVSVAFLATYLTYHGALKHFTGVGHKPYAGAAALQGVYRVLLVSHILLAAVTPILAVITIYRGLKEQWDRHRKIAKITFPIWLYVSITGVVIYFMNMG
ncbi:MAG: DUF420 domain-containing protein [Planctomycetaceae bacterium]